MARVTERRPGDATERRAASLAQRAVRLLPLAAALALALIGTAFVLSGYILRNPPVALGWDTPTYVWQAKQVGAFGLVDPVVASRPGFALLTAALAAFIPLPEYQSVPVIAAVLPAVAGLSAAALVRRALGLDPVATAAVALAVTTSFFAVRMAGGLYSNLLALTFVAAALVPLSVRIHRGRAGGPALLLLLLAAGASHWIFLGVFLAVGGAVLAWYLVEAVRTGGDAARIWRLLALLALVGAGTLALVFPVLGGRPNVEGVTRVAASFLVKFQALLRGTVPEVVFPLAGLGAAVLLVGRRRPGVSFLRRLTLVWVAVTLASFVAWTAIQTIPLHRFYLFTLPVPILVGLGASVVGWGVARGLPGRSGRARQAVRAAGAGAMIVAAAVPSFFFLTTNLVPYMTPDELHSATALDAYITTVPEARPTIVVLDRPEARPAVLRHDENVIRSALSRERQDAVTFYWGTFENLRAGRPTAGLDEAEAADRWTASRELLSRPHEVVLLFPQGPAAFRRAVGAGAVQVAPGVAALDPAGERVATPPRFRDSPLNTPLGAGTAGGAVVVVLFVLGLGWSRGLLPGEDAFTAAALAPAFGAAMVLVVSLAAEIVGLAPARGGGILAAVLTVGGGALLALRRRRFDRDPSVSPA